MNSRNAIVIGSGVIGAACAYSLARTGWKVTILEKNTFASQCSHGNCGFVCPSHVLPLATPDAIRSTLKALLKRNSPFKIRPGLRFSLWRWLWDFAKRCNERDMLETAPSIQALLKASRQLYEQLLNEENISCEWQAKGLMFVFRTAGAFEHYEEINHLLTEKFQAPARKFSREALLEFEPALKPDLAGGWWYEHDAHLRPDVLMTQWRKVLTEKYQVRILEKTEVKGFLRQGQKAQAVQTNQGEQSADLFVLAAGALTPFLNDHLGCRLPIQPGKGYSLTMNLPEQAPKIPLIFEEDRVAVTPMQTGYRLGSMMEFIGYDSSIPEKRLQYLKETAARYLHDPGTGPVLETWYGWRPMTTDSKPVIGPAPALKNVLLAAGHNMLGLSMAPATGQLIAELANQQTPFLDVRPYDPKRFG